MPQVHAFFSPFNDGIIFTSDGRGDYESTTIWHFNRVGNRKLDKIYSATSVDSFGYFYGRITNLLGFKPMRHEGKVTGLVAYGNPKNALNLCKKMMVVKNGDVYANLGNYFRPFFNPLSEILVKEISNFSKEDVAK